MGNLGDGIALAAGPLLIASQTRDPVLIAAGAMAGRVPTLVVGLYAGAMADRLDRRRVIVVANLVRAAILLGLIAALLSERITMWVTLLALLLVGVAEQFADSASRAILPMVVPHPDLGQANARLLASFLVANELVGPPLGALLFGVGMVAPFGTQVVALLLAAWLVLRIDLPGAGVRVRTRHIGTDIVDGVRWIVDSPPVRTLAVLIFAFNLTWGAPWGVLVFWAQEQLHTGAVGFGLLSAASGLGGMVAIASYDWLERRFALATLMKVVLVLEVFMHLVFANTTVLGLALVGMVIFGGYAFVWGSISTAMRQRATPQAFQGRVNSVYAFGMTAGLLVGQFVGGVIATHWGAAAPFWFAFFGSGLTLALVWRRLDALAQTNPAPA